MFDLGFAELLVIGVVALIVVGPKDLPVLFRKVGQLVGKAKGMAREFSSAMNQAADEAGVNEIQKGLNAAANPMKAATDGVKDAAKSFQTWHPDAESGGLSAERVDAAKKMHDASAKMAQERLDREAAMRETASTTDAAKAGSGAVDGGAASAKPKAASKATAAAKPKTAKPKTAKPKAAKPKTAKPKTAATAKSAAKPKAATKANAGKPTTKAKSTKDSA